MIKKYQDFKDLNEFTTEEQKVMKSTEVNESENTVVTMNNLW